MLTLPQFPKDEWVDVIDSQNRVIGSVPRLVSYAQKLSHRVVHVMVVHENKVYLVRRALGVRYLPGFYCSSAGGHVLAGETSEAGALRELKEEIGLEGPLNLLSEFFFEHEFKVHVSVFLKRFDSALDTIVLNPHEVMSGRFYSPLEIEALDCSLFHPQLRSCLDLVIGFQQSSRGGV